MQRQVDATKRVQQRVVDPHERARVDLLLEPKQERQDAKNDKGRSR